MNSVEVISVSDSDSCDSSVIIVKQPDANEKSNQALHCLLTDYEGEAVTLSSFSHRSIDCYPTSVKKPNEINNINVLTSQIFNSPSPMSKVSHWLTENARNCGLLGECIVDNETQVTANKMSVLVRQDYKKTLSEGLQNVDPKVANSDVRKTSGNDKTYILENDNINQIGTFSNNVEIIKCTDQHIDREQSEVTFKPINNNKEEKSSIVPELEASINMHQDKVIEIKESSTNTAPVNAETQKKIELCEYLKLMNMNPVDKKIIGIRQNRRSSRVKHLALLSEKKDLERQLNSETGSSKSNKFSSNGMGEAVKFSDTDSKNSSDNDKGSRKSSKKSSPMLKPSNDSKSEKSTDVNKTKTVEHQNGAKTPSIPPSETLKPTETLEKRKTPSKFLQVPEVSTTSKLQSKNVNQAVLENEIVTKQSFSQLCMNVENLRSLRKMRLHSTDSNLVPLQVHDELACFAKSVVNIPNSVSDFDEWITEIIPKAVKRRNSEKSNAVENKKTKSNDKNKKQKKNLISNAHSNSRVVKSNGIKYNVALKSRRQEEFLKKLNKPNTRLAKKSFKHKKYSYRKVKTVHRLRGRGRLKQINIKTILKKDKKEKSLKQLNTKEFKSMNLLQITTTSTENADKESLPNKNLTKQMKRCIPNPGIWENFTEEHKKAFIESIKFVKARNSSSVVNSLLPKITNEDKEVDKKEKVLLPAPNDAVDENNMPVKIKLAKWDGFETSSSLQPNCEEAAGSASQKSVLTFEDMEVDRLMNSSLKSKEEKEESKTASNSVVLDRARCSSCSSNGLSAKTSSLKMEKSIPEPLPSTSAITTESPSTTNIELQSSVPELVNISQVEVTTCKHVPLPNATETKTLQHCLTQPKKKHPEKSRDATLMPHENWKDSFEGESSPRSSKRASHSISLSNNNGAIVNCYYIDFNLIIVQEFMVSFWTQTPLGNILGAQDMWISKGSSRRMVLGNGCVNKESSEMVMSSDDTVAYIELWTKEHKSDKRERPVADIFVAIYLRLSRSSGPEKKVLQLENIHGCANDVQYIVLRNSRSIIVSWTVKIENVSSTLVHCYNLSANYQMVTSITEMQTVGHYVSSLHNIQNCDTLCLGFGENKLTLWDLEHGYIVATIELVQTQPPPRIIWAKCDRGFLFTLNYVNEELLQLIAINSFDSTWKRLQTFKPEQEHKSLSGVCMENGILVSFYEDGISCWSTQSGDLILEGPYEDDGVFLPSGKHVVIVLNNQVHVRNALEYLVTISPFEDS